MAFKMNAPTPSKKIIGLYHTLFNHCFQLSHFPSPGKEVKVITLPNPARVQNSLNLYPISLLSMIGKLSEKAIMKALERHIIEKDLLHPSWFGSCTCHNTTHHFKFIRFMDHVTLNFCCRLLLWYSRILRKPLILHSTLDHYINYPA